MFLLLLSSLLMFAVNGVCIEILKEVFGPTPVTLMAALAVSSLGFAFGLNMIKKSFFENFLSNSLGILFMVIGSLLTPIQLAMMGNPWLGYLFGFFSFLASVLCGRSAVRFIYSDRPEQNAQRYGLFYFISAALVFVCLFFTETLGKDHILIAVGLLTLLFAYVEQKKSRDRFFTYYLGFSGEAYSLGLITGVCLGVYLFMISWLFHSSGAELLIYLFITWLYLGLSPFFHRIFRFKPFTYALLGLCLFLILIVGTTGLSFWKSDAQVLFNLADIKKMWKWDESPTLFSMGSLFAIGLVFFLPMACIIPAFETRDQGRNYLYSNSLGHFTGFLFLCLFGFMWLYPLILITVLIACFIGLRDHGFSFIRKPLFFALIILIFLVPPTLEENALQQAQKSRPSCKGCEITTFIGMEKSKGLIGFIGIDENQTPQFGVNEAQSPIYDIYDYQKAFVAQDFISKDKNRVLLLGLGNHALYQELLEYRNQSGLEFKIDVVEPLPQFKNPSFRKKVASLQGWKNDDKRDQIFFERVIEFLLSQRDGSYDLILWNLPEDLSVFAHSRFTLEFFKEVRRILESDGYLIAPNNENSKLACFLNSLYAGVGSYPRKEAAPASVLIASDNNSWSGNKIEACSKFQSPRISRFFFQRERLLDRQQKVIKSAQVPQAPEINPGKPSKAISFAQALTKEKETLVTVLPISDEWKSAAEEFLYGLRSGFAKMSDWQILPLTCNEPNVACAHKIFSFARLNSASSLLAPFGFATGEQDKNFKLQTKNLSPFLTIEPASKTAPLFNSDTILSEGLDEVLKWMRLTGRGGTVKVVDLSNNTSQYWSQGQWQDQEMDPDAFLEIISVDQLDTLKPGAINNIKRSSRFLYIKGAIKSRRQFNRIRLYYDRVFFFPGFDIGLSSYCDKASVFETQFKRRPDYFMELGYQYARMRNKSNKMELVAYDTRSMDLVPLNGYSVEICEK